MRGPVTGLVEAAREKAKELGLRPGFAYVAANARQQIYEGSLFAVFAGGKQQFAPPAPDGHLVANVGMLPISIESLPCSAKAIPRDATGNTLWYVPTMYTNGFGTPRKLGSQTDVILQSGEYAVLQDGRYVRQEDKLSSEGDHDVKLPGESLLPPIAERVSGSNQVRIKNGKPFSVLAGLRSAGRGQDLNVPANSTRSIGMPDGVYKIYFVYSGKPNALFQGDPFTLKNNVMEIQIEKVVNGNYRIRQVK
jgi:hypothetical protein